MSVAINRAVLLKTRGTPSEVVDTGEAYFWLDGSSLKYKDSTQTVYTLSSGVTPEDVQDIVGAFITSGNTKLTAVYNDAGNSFVITLVESNIIHQNLSGAGTNTHAQIDSHIANTSNPHATTATQVGADPSGTAVAQIAAHVALADPHTQYLTAAEGNAAYTAISHVGSGGSQHAIATTSVDGFMSSVDKTKLNGIATGATANSTDANLRDRSTHTGTQLASTISDFSAAALAVVLTGISFLSSVAVVAADSILIAIGKLQAQITVLFNRNINTGTGLAGGGSLTNDITLSIANTGAVAGTYGTTTLHSVTVNAQGQITSIANGPALALGDQFEDFEDSTLFTTTSITNVVAALFTTLSKPTGRYRIGLFWDWTTSVTNSDAIFGLYIDGVLQGIEWREEVSETATQNIPRSSFKYITFGTVSTHTIELRVRNEAAGTTTTVNIVRAEIWRMT